MARFALYSFIFVQILLSHAMANLTEVQSLNPLQRLNHMRLFHKAVNQPAPSSAESSKASSHEAKGKSNIAEAPGNRRLGKQEHHHHSQDKSVAGGGLIIGGLVTAIFAAVFCYIRVTRKRDAGL